MALQLHARRGGIRLPDLSEPARQGTHGLACIGTTLLLWAAGDFYYTLFLWIRQCPRQRSPTGSGSSLTPSSTRGSASSCGEDRHFERSLWLDAALAALAVAAVGAAVLFGAVVESTGGSP